METQLHANDISCKHCAMAIKRELAPLEGINSVEVDIDTKTISLDYADDRALEQAKATLDEIGYPVS